MAVTSIRYAARGAFPVRDAGCGMRGYWSDSAFRNPQSASGRGQAAVEYAVLVAVMVAALIAMCVYTKRALSGKWRAVGDTFGHGRQYEPGVTVAQ